MTALTRLTPGSIRVVPIPDHRPPPITPGERSAERPYVQDALAFDLANDVSATMTLPTTMLASTPPPPMNGKMRLASRELKTSPANVQNWIIINAPTSSTQL